MTSDDLEERMARLEERVTDLRDMQGDTRDLVKDFRDDCQRRFDALTKQGPDGEYQPASARIDVKLWVAFVATVVVPVVVAIITTKGG